MSVLVMFVVLLYDFKMQTHFFPGVCKFTRVHACTMTLAGKINVVMLSGAYESCNHQKLCLVQYITAIQVLHGSIPGANLDRYL